MSLLDALKKSEETISKRVVGAIKPVWQTHDKNVYILPAYDKAKYIKYSTNGMTV